MPTVSVNRPRIHQLKLLICSALVTGLGTAQDVLDEAGRDALIVYEVEGDRLLSPKENPDAALDAELEAVMADREYHQVLWEDFALLIPAEHRTDITRLAIFTDGEEDLLASVTPNSDDIGTWTLALDAVDGTDFDDDLVHTLIHEFGHILSLSPQQVPRDPEVFDRTANDEDAAYEQAEARCPTFFTGEGCSIRASYINAFFGTFWREIYGESFYLDEGELYARYPDEFVSEYASTNPGEDIAESWTLFVLEDKPVGDTVAEQKVRFFYDYPELVKLRDAIRTNLDKL